MDLFLSFCLGAIAVAALMWFRVRHYGFAGQVAMDYDGEAPAFDAVPSGSLGTASNRRAPP